MDSICICLTKVPIFLCHPVQNKIIYGWSNLATEPSDTQYISTELLTNVLPMNMNDKNNSNCMLARLLDRHIVLLHIVWKKEDISCTWKMKLQDKHTPYLRFIIFSLI
jgi:hypothetical protein